MVVKWLFLFYDCSNHVIVQTFETIKPSVKPVGCHLKEANK